MGMGDAHATFFFFFLSFSFWVFLRPRGVLGVLFFLGGMARPKYVHITTSPALVTVFIHITQLTVRL